ncbi:MAG: EcsC family protein [Bacteroidota bacterium]|nr:EcsC family protein [Bacteroidota bacterium]
MENKITDTDLAHLKAAKYKLENPAFLIELSNTIGKPIEKIYTSLPQRFQESIVNATKTVLLKSLDILISRKSNKEFTKPNNMMHKVFVAGTGAAGGFFGLAALAIELPVTTAIMLRSIVDIARSKGFDINKMSTKLACIEVFALGGNSKKDDYSESTYYLTRGALAKAMSEANKYLLEKGAVKHGAPVIVNFISKVSSRFGIIVSQEAAAKSIPIIGAVSGSAINLVFIDHFQKMAEAHFTVMHLEDKYGKEEIMEIYKSL